MGQQSSQPEEPTLLQQGSNVTLVQELTTSLPFVCLPGEEFQDSDCMGRPVGDLSSLRWQLASESSGFRQHNEGLADQKS